MSPESAVTVNIALKGDWSINGISEQHKILTEQLNRVIDAQQHGITHQPEIRLSGIDPLDASGGQLLAVFLHNLQQHGFTPSLQEISEPLMAKMQCLGFDHACAPLSTAKEQA